MPRLLKDRTTVPPGGYQYRVPETGLLLHGHTLAATARAASEHLRANGISRTPHELATLIEAQICDKHPEACFSQPRAAAPAPPTGHRKGHKWSLAEIKRGADSFFRYLKPDHYVDFTKTFARATVCSTCPLNVPSEACASCTSGLLYLVKSRLGKSRVSALDAKFTGERKLKLCDACGCFPLAKCQLTIESVVATTPADAIERIRKEAPGCWILKETKENPK